MKKTINYVNTPYLSLHYPLLKRDDSYSHGIYVSISNDILCLTGLFSHFANWTSFTENKVASSGYIEIAKQIFRVLGATELIVCSEWCMINEEHELFYSDFEALKQAHPQKIKDHLEGLSAFDLHIIAL
ncbi:hypothetical protein FQZ97_988520 [compost metagenome]